MNSRSSPTDLLAQPLTPREQDVLNGLGEGLSNRQIAERLNFALSTVKWYVRQIYNKLGVANRQEAVVRAQTLGLLPGEAAANAIRHNLTAVATPFVGREQELATLDALLADQTVRLITLIGPGGIGKTRLALEVARRQLHPQTPFPDGIFFISLAAVEAAQSIEATLATALNIQFQGSGSLTEQLLNYLAIKQMLLVMDNFEHLLAGRPFLVEIGRRAAGVTLLVTSRERLQLQGEQLFPLHGLDTEPGGDSGKETPAAQLFLNIARRSVPDFQLLAGDGEPLQRICQLVEGMPLGLELAASWAGLLPLTEIAAEIGQSLHLLATEHHDMPPRHRSMEAALAVSWRRLHPEQQLAFQKLTVFRGGFTRPAAVAVAGATLPLLVTLVNKSWLTYDRPGDRYHIHELLRQYGAEKLAENGERETAVRNRHSTYYCQTLGEKEGDVRGQRGFIDLAEIGADLGNIEAAWRWAVHRRLWSNLHQASYPLFRFYKWSVRHQDSLPLYQLTVEQLAPGNMTEVEDRDAAWVLARVLIWLASCFLYLEQWPRAETLFQQSQALLQSQALAQADTQREQAFLFFTKAAAAFPILSFTKPDAALPEYQEALEFAQKSLLLARASGDQWQEAETLKMLGEIYEEQSNVEMAQKSFDEALILYRSLTDTVSIAGLLQVMGWLARNVMDYKRSEALFQESLILFRSQSYQPGIADVLTNLGYLELFLGEFESGTNYLQQAAKVIRENGYLRYLALTLAALASAYTFLGHLSQARQCLEESLKISETIPFPLLLQSVLVEQAKVNIWMGRYKAAQITVSRIFSFFDETVNPTGAYVFTTPLFALSGWLALTHSDFTTAREHLQIVVDYSRQFYISEEREWSAIYQATLSRAEWGLNQRAAARQNLYEALAVAVKIRAFITLLHVLPIAPIILAAEDDVCQKIRAIEIYALAHSHPFIANCQFFYDIAGKDVEAVEAALPSDIVTAAKARGQALDFWQTAESLLAELQALGWNEMRPAQP